MSRSVLSKTRLCSALLGVGLLALTGCGGGSNASLVEVADTIAAPSASATPSPLPSAPPMPASTPSPAPTSTPEPVVTVHEEWVEEPVAFTSRRQDDPNLDRGVEALAIVGVAGVKATRFQVTLTDGVETGRVPAGEEMRVVPVQEVIAVGSKAPVVIAPPAPVQAAVPAASGCDPNYEGDCVPIDSDVDCASGNGNGPSYVQGPVRVVGTDIYGLDGKDGDGIGCE
ncbi:G5 domain-containing protein [Arthrobacter sp. MDT2-16]